MIRVTTEAPVAWWQRLALSLTRQPRIPLTLRKKLGALLPREAGRVFRAKVFDGVFEGRTGSHLDDKVWLYGLHEAATIRLMRELLLQDRTAGRTPALLDIGTNAGLHLVACAGLCDRALGFEPWQPVRARAKASLKASGFRHARVMDHGLGDEEAALPFHPPGAGGNHGVGTFSHGPQQVTGTLTLRVRRGDAVVAELGVVPTLLKIDTEGFEQQVLRGLRGTIERDRPAILFEMGGTREDRAQLASDVLALLPAGYTLHGLRRSREWPSLFPLRPGDRCENALAMPEGRQLS